MKGGGGSALKELVAKGFRGVRLYPLLMHGYSLGSSFVDEVCSAAGELKVPVIAALHGNQNIGTCTID